MQAFPQTHYSRGSFGNAPMEPVGSSTGMSIRQMYMAHILAGLASNPTTMLNIEDHLEYAWRMAGVAFNISAGG